jgi:two-component sensor histidine kinase
METILDPKLPDPSSGCLEQAPSPMARVEGPSHVVCYVNAAFCRLTKKTRQELTGKPLHEIFAAGDEFLALLDRVHRSGKSESYTRQEHSGPRPTSRSYSMWPVTGDGDRAGVMIQVIESAPLYQDALAMNEALVLGSLRMHELTEFATSSNDQLKTEVGERKQRELDARMLTNEVSHRIKNNLQIVVGLIGHEAKRAAAPCVAGYQAMQARIGAIAQLYDLVSQTSSGSTVPVEAYLKRIARTLSASLLGEASNITIEVIAEALEIGSERALPFGLLVNELATNAVKHAFPGRIGRVVLSARRIGDQIELSVTDNGAGMKAKNAAKTPEHRGADFVAIFARQLGATMAVLGSEGTGTTVRVRFPLLVLPYAA